MTAFSIANYIVAEVGSELRVAVRIQLPFFNHLVVFLNIFPLYSFLCVFSRIDSQKHSFLLLSPLQMYVYVLPPNALFAKSACI